MTISPARIAAFDVLRKIEVERAFSSVLLPLYEARLTRVDAALCHEITLGVLRRQIYLDRLIDTMSGGRRLDAAVRICLRIGLFQLTELTRIPAHSAVNESVALVSRARKTSAKGFVNAMLRGFLRERPKLSFNDELEKLVTTTSHPRSLIQKWVADHGIAEAALIATANNEMPSTAFRVLRRSAFTDELIASSRESAYVEGCWIAQKGERRVQDLQNDGSIYIQDEGSQLVAATLEIPDSGRFIDVCASPGSKCTMIANRYAAEAKLIVAGDLYNPRVATLKSNCETQLPGTIAVVQYNAESTRPFADQCFDRILVDAPCSGTGTIRHNPEIRYRVPDFTELRRKQLAILHNASKLLAHGGTMIYSTCSLEAEENEEVALEFLKLESHFSRIEVCVPGNFRSDDGFARTWPHRDSMDGFFIAGFTRLK